MPLVIGYNVFPNEHWPELWRTKLSRMIEDITANFWNIKSDDVSCFFPHDPSVPVSPLPIATFIVELLFERPERTLQERSRYAKVLADAIKTALAEMGDTNRKVEVAVKRFNPDKDGFFMTP